MNRPATLLVLLLAGLLAGCGGSKVKTVHKGDTMGKIAGNYLPVVRDGAVFWIHCKYVKEEKLRCWKTH